MSKLIEHLSDYEEEANLRRSTFGKTNKHTTGFSQLDQYLGSGYGNVHGYEIITVFGATGVGKSMFSLNMVGAEMARGTMVGLMILEDDMPDVYNRVQQIIGEGGMASVKRRRNVDVLPKHMLEQAWKFADILKWIEDKHNERGIGLFLLDHINFLFDNASLVDPRREMAEQREFMRNLNYLCRRLKLTVILVSHTAKGDHEGMDKVYGTTAITQVSTKVIGVKHGDEPQQFVVTLFKSRFTARQDTSHIMKRTGLKLEEYDTVQSQPVPVRRRAKRS